MRPTNLESVTPTDAAFGVPPGLPQDQNVDARKVWQVCQTCARNGPRVSTCAGFVEDYLGVSNRGDLAVLGSVRVYVTKPLARASSTGALTSFGRVCRPIQGISHSRPTLRKRSGRGRVPSPTLPGRLSPRGE